MKDGTKNKTPLLIVIIGILILVIVKGSANLQEMGLFLPAVGLLLLLALIWIFSMAYKSWKTPAEEVAEEVTEASTSVPGQAPGVQERLKRFAAGILFLAIIYLQGGTPPLPFVVLVLLITGLPLVGALIRKAQGREGEPFFANARINPRVILECLFFLACFGFACFWCGLCILHRIWFILPFGVGIGLCILRPLVARIQLLLREFRDPGEKHVRSKKEDDPWDRPDKEY